MSEKEKDVKEVKGMKRYADKDAEIEKLNESVVKLKESIKRIEKSFEAIEKWYEKNVKKPKKSKSE